MDRDGVACADYVKSKEKPQGGELYAYQRKIRRLTHLPTPRNEDQVFGSELTFYDLLFQLPWDNEYRILGEDTFKGQECLVVESKSVIHPDHYNSKEVLWIDKKLFRDLHGEQFDRSGVLYKVTDKKWIRLPEKEGNWWLTEEFNIINLNNGVRSIIGLYDQIIDAGRPEVWWEFRKMTEEHVWRKVDPKKLPPVIKKVEDLPPAPEVRLEFWNKIGVKPTVPKTR